MEETAPLQSLVKNFDGSEVLFRLILIQTIYYWMLFLIFLERKKLKK